MTSEPNFKLLDFFSRLNESLNPHIVIRQDGVDWVTVAAGFGGVILGAVLGGAIQWWISTKQANQQKREIQWAQALRAMMQASIVLSDVAATIRSIHSSLEEANAKGLTAQPFWQRIVPMIGTYSAEPLDVEVLGPFLAAREYTLVGQYVEMSMKHQVLGEAVKSYYTLRGQMDDSMPRTMVSESGALHSDVTFDERAKMLPLSIRLESLITSIREQSNELYDLAKTVNVAIGPAARKYFNDPSFPHLEVFDDPH